MRCARKHQRILSFNLLSVRTKVDSIKPLIRQVFPGLVLVLDQEKIIYPDNKLTINLFSWFIMNSL